MLLITHSSASLKSQTVRGNASGVQQTEISEEVMTMPSGQFYILDHPDLTFTASYHIDTVNEKPFKSRIVLEIQKQLQPTEAFDAVSIGQQVTFVSSSGEAQRMYLISNADDQLVFSSRA